MEFTKEMARTMGERGARERESLLMICHGQDAVKQLVYHVLMRPSYSFLDVCGTIPMDYLEGELILPVYIPNNKIFLGLIASQHAKCKSYDPETFIGEIGEKDRSGLGKRDCSLLTRAPRAEQASSKGSYARQTHTTRRARM